MDRKRGGSSSSSSQRGKKKKKGVIIDNYVEEERGEEGKKNLQNVSIHMLGFGVALAGSWLNVRRDKAGANF